MAAEAGGHRKAREGAPSSSPIAFAARSIGPASGAGRSSRPRPSSPVVAASAPLLPERTARSVSVRTRARQSPVWAACGVARTITPPPAPRSLPSSAARAAMSPRSASRARARPDEFAGRLVARPFRRARPLDLERRRASSPSAEAGRRRPAAPPVAKLADDDVGHPQLHLADSGAEPAASPPRRRRRGDGEDRARAVDQGDAGVGRRGGGTRHRGQPGARLDRLRERIERASARPGRFPPAAGRRPPRPFFVSLPGGPDSKAALDVRRGRLAARSAVRSAEQRREVGPLVDDRDADREAERRPARRARSATARRPSPSPRRDRTSRSPAPGSGS